MRNLKLAALVVSGASAAVAAVDGPIVQTDDGPIQGTHPLGDDSVIVYRGIPFAAPPTGALRWKAPERPTPWTSPIKRTKKDPKCPQLDLVKGLGQGQEDCLYATVYVPKACAGLLRDGGHQRQGGRGRARAAAAGNALGNAKKCPVMQWIYGGAWIEGSDSAGYDGTKLARAHGVVVVTANYRLDTLGWLSLPELAAEQPDGAFGNYGLRDQRAALMWTQRNVAALGGDPGAVTIFGESAGGFSVCQQLVSPASNGLFSAAIMQSGDCDGPWMIHPGADALNFGSSVATALGCPPGAARLACLRAKPVKDVMIPYDKWLCKDQPHPETDPWCNKTVAARRAAAAVPQSAALDALGLPPARWPSLVPPMAPIAGFTAVVDGTAAGLPDSPLRLIRAGKINRSPAGKNVTVLMGTNSDELALFMVSMPEVIPGVTLPVRAAGVSAVGDHVTAYHDGWNATTARQFEAAYPVGRYGTQANRLTAAGTDFCFRCGTRQAARALAAAGIDVYLYHFDYRTPSYKDPASVGCELLDEVGCGVFHGVEVPYVWQGRKAASDGSAGGKAVSAAMGTYWTNVAKYGTPNSPAMPVQWPKYSAATDQNLRIASTCSVETGYAKQTCDFWDSLPSESPYV